MSIFDVLRKPKSTPLPSWEEGLEEIARYLAGQADEFFPTKTCRGISLDTKIADSGIDDLMMVGVVMHVEDRYDIEIDDAGQLDIPHYHTVRDLAKAIMLAAGVLPKLWSCGMCGVSVEPFELTEQGTMGFKAMVTTSRCARCRGAA